MEPWPDDRIWEAVEAWRWIPPGAQRVTGRGYEVAVVAGSYMLTNAYGLRATDGADADRLLSELQHDVISRGGTGVEVHWTPNCSPPDLPERLMRSGYRLAEEAEVLVWELRGRSDEVRLPPFRDPPGMTAREATTDADFDDFVALEAPIFGSPKPSAEILRAFREDFHQSVRDRGHSGCYVARDGTVPIGRAGQTIVGPVGRMWGTGVLESYRRRGAYGLLVRARCEEAARNGCEIAIVTARVGSSGPILKHHGFRVVGAAGIYEARWAPEAPGGPA
jgi:hypothetical protein